MFWRDDIDPDNEPAKVLLKRGDFIDGPRDDRDVPWKLYYPVLEKPQKCPLIVWSHGFGGNRDGASFLSRYLAAQGYVVFHPTHRGTDSSLWEGKEGHPWDILRKIKTPRETTLNRMYDIPFALEQLKGWAAENPEVGEIIDFDTVGMSGHSFGALTTQVMAGQLIPTQEGEFLNLKDSRFKAGILYSPVPIGHMTDEDPAKIYSGIDIPMLHMTGTDDDSPIEGFDYKHRLVIHEHSAGEKYLLVKKDGDHMVYNGTRGKLANNPNRELHENIIKVTAHAFWDAYLRGDAEAKDWVQGRGAQAFLGESATLEYP